MTSLLIQHYDAPQARVVLSEDSGTDDGCVCRKGCLCVDADWVGSVVLQLFLQRALMPLHKPKCVGMYHQQLAYCVTQVNAPPFHFYVTLLVWLPKKGEDSEGEEKQRCFWKEGQALVVYFLVAWLQ